MKHTICTFRVLGILLFISIMMPRVGWGQTTIFNHAGGGSAPSGWTFTNNVTTNPIDKTTYWLADAGATSDLLISNTIDLSAYSSAVFTIDVATFGSGANNPAKVEVSYNGGTSYTQTVTTGTPTSSTYITNQTVTLSSVSSQVVIRISNNGTTGKGVRMQNLKLVASGTSCTPPTTQATIFTSSAITATTATAGWTRGNGDNVLVVARSGSAVNADPSSGTSYSANAAFGSGTQIGTGNYVVYNGSGTSVNLTGLTSGTTYHFAVYEYATTGTCYNTTELTGNFTTTVVTPDIALSSPNPAVAATNILQNTTNNVIYRFDLAVTSNNATLTNIVFNTAGTFAASNLTNIKLWYSADATFSSGSDALLATKTTNLATNPQTFTAFNQQVINNGTTGYFFLTTDLPCTATAGNTISVNAITTADLTFATGNKTGTAYAGGLQTITAATPNNVTAQTTSACSSGGTTVSWTAPAGCSDNVLVFAKAGAFTATLPTGNGVSYTANTAFGTGTAFDGGFCVFKGTGTTVSITGLTNGTNYTYKIFTRNGTSWSAGVTANCTPSLDIPDNGCTTSTFAELSLNYPTSIGITDINVGVKISHTYRGDLRISLISPDNTEVLLVNEIGGSADNFDAIIDDQGTTNAFTTGNHTVDATYDFTGQPQGSGVGSLSAFYGKNAQGTWKIRVCDDAGGDAGSIVSGELFITGCNSTASITSFLPATAPAGAVVTITGTGFTGAAGVSFNGVNAASYTVVNSTTITAEVPTGASTGKISVFDNVSCPTLSTSTFTFLNEAGACGGNFTDLIISEVYDSDANNVFNVELFNPTASAITLTGVYSIGIKTDNAGGFVRTVALTGSVPALGIYVAELGTSSQICSYSYDFSSSGSGINALDGVYLVKNGTDVDVAVAPNQTGYSLVRLNSVSGPTATYNSADWDIQLVESCTGIGSFTPTATVSVTAHPVDVTACSFSMSVTATGSGLTYQWVFNDQIAMTDWQNVTVGNLSASNPSNSNVTITGSTTNSLTITGDVTHLYNYQFYCIVTKGGCDKSSNAAQFLYDTAPVYRSVAAANGNWSSVSNWEMALSTAGPWSAACSYPVAANSTEVLVQSGTNIVLDIDNQIDKLTIDGTLETSSNAQLVIKNGTSGADFILNGIFYNRSNSANALDFEDNSGTTNDATWTFTSGATVIKTNSAGTSAMRDFYEGGISTIPATGDWIYRYNADGAPATGTIGMFYPNLTFENVTGSPYAWNAFSTALTGATGGFATVKGNMNIGTSGSSTCDVYNNNINTQPMLIMGNLTIGTGSSLLNTSYNGSSSSSHGNGTGLEVRGNVTIEGTLDLNTASIGMLKFSGTGTQTVSGAGTIDLWNMELNKTAETLVTLMRNVSVNNNLNFVSGIVNVNSLSNYIYILNNATSAVTGYSASGATDKYVRGTLRRAITTATDYAFPIGDATHGHQTAQLNFANLNGATYAEGYYSNAGASTSATDEVTGCDLDTDADLPNDKAQYTNLSGTWEMTADVTTGLDYTATFSPAGANPYGGSIDNMKHGGSYVLTCNGTGTHDAPLNSTGNTTQSGLTHFTPFQIGSGAPANVLPVELLYFNAVKQNKKALLSWATATERDNDYFAIERSTNGYTFTEIGRKEGKGNSNETTVYNYTDNDLSAGTYYYRLRQVDFNGEFDYSDIVAVTFSDNNVLSIYPNPTKNEVFISLSENTQTDATVELFDNIGRLVLKQHLPQGVSSSSINLSELPNGYYFVRLTNGNQTVTERVGKN